MKQREIIRDGRLYTLISVFAKEERTTPRLLYNRIERGLPTVMDGGHIYVNRDDYRAFCGIPGAAANSGRRDTLTIDGRAYHALRWYMARHPVTRTELWDLPYVMVRGTRYVAEDDFMQKYWWMEG